MKHVHVTKKWCEDRRRFRAYIKFPISKKRTISKTLTVEVTEDKPGPRQWKKYEKQADDECRKLEREYEKREIAGYKHVTWEELEKMFFEEHERKLKPRSVDAYQIALNSFRNLMKPTEASNVTIATLREYEKKLVSYRHPKRGALSESSRSNYVRHILAVLRWAKTEDLLHPDVSFRDYRIRAKATTQKGRPLTRDELKQFYEAIEETFGQPVYDIAKHETVENPKKDEIVAAWTRLIKGLELSGLRLGEAIRLSWTKKSVPHVIITDDGWPFIHFPEGQQKNNRYQNWLPPEDFADFLLETPEDERKGPVFQLISEKGAPLKMDLLSVSKRIADIGKKSGIVVGESRVGSKVKKKFASAHDLRRTCANKWRLAGAGALEVMDIMRHQSYQTTADFYAGDDILATKIARQRAFQMLQGAKSGANDGKRTSQSITKKGRKSND